MSFELLPCLLVLILAAIACEGDSRHYFRTPNYRDLYYRNQFYEGLANLNPKPVPTPMKLEEINDGNDDTEEGLFADEKPVPEDIYTFTPVSELGRGNPLVLRPLLVSLQTELRRMLKSQNENQELQKSILSVNNETLAWEMTQANSFYSLISSLVPSH